MALYREYPKCPFCKKVIAKGVYKDQSNLPVSMQIIGDTFIRWEYEKHECEEEKVFINNLPKIDIIK